MKVARTVLRGGKTERSYLSQQKVAGSNPATLTVNILATSPEKKCQDSRHPSGGDAKTKARLVKISDKAH